MTGIDEADPPLSRSEFRGKLMMEAYSGDHGQPGEVTPHRLSAGKVRSLFASLALGARGWSWGQYALGDSSSGEHERYAFSAVLEGPRFLALAVAAC